LSLVILLPIPALNAFLATSRTPAIAVTLGLASMARDACSLAPPRRVRLEYVAMFGKVA
jgi:hypothetical protein